MKKFLLIASLIAGLTGNAQEKHSMNLYTDRSVYCSGETILFKIFASDNDHSEVARIDLINLKGKIIGGVNKKISNHQAEGFLTITDSLNTGSYLICSSTAGSQEIASKELFVCNRFSGISETLSLKQTRNVVPLEDKKENAILIGGLSNELKAREVVNLTISMSEELTSKITGDISVSIATIAPGYEPVSFNLSTDKVKSTRIAESGLEIKGTVRDLISGNPFKNGIVFFSVPDSVPGFNYFITGEDGKYSFKVNQFYGKLPVVLRSFDLANKRLTRLFPDQRDSLFLAGCTFESKEIPLDLQKSIAQSIDATTIRKIFNQKELEIGLPPARIIDKYRFYGDPTDVIYTNQFIELPNFTEISRELLPGFKFRAYNRIPTLNYFNPVNQSYFTTQPLVLLDGIPVQDLNTIKNMGSKEIRKIELCRIERFYGDLQFPGVVAIFTPQNDFRQLKEGKDLLKFSLEGLQQQANQAIVQNNQPNEPDLRKVLIWEPNVKAEKTVKLNFRTSDVQGAFKVIVRARTTQGNTVYNEQIFEVH